MNDHASKRRGIAGRSQTQSCHCIWTARHLPHDRIAKELTQLGLVRPAQRRGQDQGVVRAAGVSGLEKNVKPMLAYRYELVCFVEDDILEVGEIDHASANEVLNVPGSTNDDVGAIREASDIRLTCEPAYRFTDLQRRTAC